MFARPPGYGSPPLFMLGRLPMNVTAIVIAVEVVGAIILAVAGYGSAFADAIVLDFRTIGHFELWRVVTYALFSPLNFFWLIGLFFFYMFGNTLESQLGASRYAKLIGALLLVSSLLIASLTFLAPATFSGSYLGPHLVHLGIFFATCSLFGKMPSGFFGVPIIYVGYIFAALSFFQYIAVRSLAGAIAVIVVCALAVYLTQGGNRRYGTPKKSSGRKKKPAPRSQKSKLRPRSSVTISSTEVDRILDKINERGFQSLTPAERETLEKSSKN